MKILSLKNVRKEYHTGSLTVLAVKDVSFDLNEGEFVVILGASGAGKTTLLNLLGGMDVATGGEIDLDGKNITSFNKKLELVSELSNSFLKSSSSAAIGVFMSDELSMHRYLPTKIVIKRLIRYFFVLLP